MNVTVIGHFCLDVIHHPNGNETQSYGGIFFSVATLANLLGANDTVYPVFGIGKGNYDEFIERLKTYPNIDPSGIYKFNAPTNQVHLQYENSSDRIECSRYIAEPIPWKKIRPYLETDMVLVNMISGVDITLETLDEIRMEIREQHVPIYMDIHSLTLGINEDCTRYHRPVENWRRWLFMLHAAQMNEEEAAILSSEKLDESNLAKQVLALNTQALVVSRGQHGCTAFIDEHKRIHRFDIPATDIAEAVDPTGCGDVFAASYCAHYLKSKDVLGAVQLANKVAAHKAQMQGSINIDNLASFRLIESRISEHTK
jgi:sugar/nucleoside kinase (ribokinase family)